MIYVKCNRKKERGKNKQTDEGIKKKRMSKSWNDDLQNINNGYLQMFGVRAIFIIPSLFFSLLFEFSVINMTLNAGKTL